MVASIHHFAHFLFGASFTVLTDHRPLTSLLTSKTLNGRLQGMALKIMQFDVSIEYREGSRNGNADGLSRQSWQLDKVGDAMQSSTDEGVSVADPDGTAIVASLPGASLRTGRCGAAHRREDREKRSSSREE